MFSLFHRLGIDFLDVKQGWDDPEINFSSPIPHDTITQTFIDTGKFISGNMQIYILRSYFKTSSKNDGGAISYANPTKDGQMLVEFTTFDDCHTSSDEGCDIFIHTGVYFALHKSC